MQISCITSLAHLVLEAMEFLRLNVILSVSICPFLLISSCKDKNEVSGAATVEWPELTRLDNVAYRADGLVRTGDTTSVRASLAELLEWPGVIRSKGVFWLATRLKVAGFWSQAGAVARHHSAGYFWAAVPRDHWPEDASHIERVWKEGNGDCRQEIVLIGRNMDQQALVSMLDHCLLTEAEVSTDETSWHKNFVDPFPEWRMEADRMEL